MRGMSTLRITRSFKHKAMETVFAFSTTMAILYILFRNFFDHGMLIYPDLFEVFPAHPSSLGYNLYFSAWNLGSFGSYNTAMFPMYSFFSLLSELGLYGVVLQESFVMSFLVISGISLAILVRRITDSLSSQFISIVIYFLSPMLFIEIFNGSGVFTFYSMAPLFALLSYMFFVERGKYSFLLLTASISIATFFLPFSIIFSLPIIISAFIVSLIIRPTLKNRLYSGLSFVAVYAFAVFLNAPYFIGNLTQLSGVGFKAVTSQDSFMLFSYQWASPFRAWTLLGAGLYPRYGIFYDQFWSAMLIALPAFSTLSLIIKCNTTKGHNTKLFLGILMLLSYGFIEGVHYGLIFFLFHYFPLMYVDNYPESFSICLNLSYSLLIPVLIHRLRHFKQEYPLSKQYNNREKRHAFRDGSLATTSIAVAVIAILMLTIIGSSFFTIEGGNFNFSEINKRIGQPPQWGVVAPPSFTAIYDFLSTHNGLSGERPWILPYPGFNGQSQFSDFYAFLFNQPYSMSSSGSGFFYAGGGISSQEYSTAIAKALVSNSTDMIGIPLGVASVKFVVVDKSLNFSGSPHWTWGSLAGNPKYFIQLLSYQKDLRLIYDNNTMNVYLNLDYRPYVQGYEGTQLMAYGNLKLSNTTVYQWPFDYNGLSKWGFGPSSLIQSVKATPNGYIINTTVNQGNFSIGFNNNSGKGFLKASTDGYMNNSGIYAGGAPIPVSDGLYSFDYSVQYMGPAASGAYVVVSGFNKNFQTIWDMPLYSSVTSSTRTTPYKQNLSANFNPYLVNYTTRYISLTIAFQYHLSQVEQSLLIFSNFTLDSIAPLGPDPLLSPLLSSQLVSGFGLNRTAVIPMTLSSISPLQKYDLPDYNVVTYVDSTTKNFSVGRPSSYLFLIPNVFHTNNSVAFTSTPSGIAGVSLSNAGKNVSGTLPAIPLSPNNTFVMAAGNGKITLTISSRTGPIKNTTISVDSSHLKWYHVLTNYSHSAVIIGMIWSGNLTTNAIFETNLAKTTLRISTTYAGVVQKPSQNLWSFKGVASSKTNVIFLSQSYYQGWVLIYQGRSVAATVGFGWGNLFNASRSASNNHRSWNFTLYFKPETVRIQTVAIQFIAWIMWGLLFMMETSHYISIIALEMRFFDFLRKFGKFKLRFP